MDAGTKLLHLLPVLTYSQPFLFINSHCEAIYGYFGAVCPICSGHFESMVTILKLSSPQF